MGLNFPLEGPAADAAEFGGFLLVQQRRPTSRRFRECAHGAPSSLAASARRSSACRPGSSLLLLDLERKQCSSPSTPSTPGHTGGRFEKVTNSSCCAVTSSPFVTRSGRS